MIVQVEKPVIPLDVFIVLSFCCRVCILKLSTLNEDVSFHKSKLGAFVLKQLKPSTGTDKAPYWHEF